MTPSRSSKSPSAQCLIDTIELEYGRILHWHMDHLRACLATAQPSVEMDDYPTIEIPSQNPGLPQRNRVFAIPPGQTSHHIVMV